MTAEGDVQLYTSDACMQPEGSEVFIKYGENSNLDLIVDYGFCIAEGNTDDFAEVLMAGMYPRVNRTMQMLRGRRT